MILKAIFTEDNAEFEADFGDVSRVYSGDAVLFTKQNLTDKQKVQARENIGIIGSGSGIYIGSTQPTDGTLYWLDTSDEVDAEPIVYTVTANLENVAISNTAESVNEGASFATTLIVDDAYVIQDVSVTMGGVDLTSSAYTGDSIYIGSVVGDIVITATAIARADTGTTYSITNNLSNVTSDNTALSVADGSEYTANLTVGSGYKIDSITITMGGTDVTSAVYADGVITIASVTGDVVITATAIKKDQYLDDEANVYKTFESNTSVRLELDTTADDLPSDNIYIYYPATSAYAAGVNKIGSAWWSAPLSGATNIAEKFEVAHYKHYADRGYNVQVLSWSKIYNYYKPLFDDGTISSNQPRAILLQHGSTSKILYNYVD